MKVILYVIAWFIVINQWNDLSYYKYDLVTHRPPIGAVIITILLTVILLVATFKVLTKGKK